MMTISVRADGFILCRPLFQQRSSPSPMVVRRSRSGDRPVKNQFVLLCLNIAPLSHSLLNESNGLHRSLEAEEGRFIFRH